MMLRNVVVLPAPLRPTRQTSSPAATDRLMPLRMRLPSMSTFRFDKIQHHCAFLKVCGRVPTTAAIMAGSAKKASGGISASTSAFLQGDDAMRVPLDQVHVVLDLDDGRARRRFRRRDQELP